VNEVALPFPKLTKSGGVCSNSKHRPIRICFKVGVKEAEEALQYGVVFERERV
jgi:hypothetical protein